MKIAIIGQAAFGKDVLTSLIAQKENIAAVICPPDQSPDRIDPLKTSALEHNIPVLQYKRMRSSTAIEEFKSLNVDLCVMAFVTDIVPDEILKAPTHGTIQYHPSLLPKYRGPSSLNWPIIYGEEKTGLSIFWPDKGLDTGPILIQKTVSIEPDDTLGSLYFQKLFPLGVEAMCEAVSLVKKGEAPKIQQDHSISTYQGWCSSDDVKIDWGLSTKQIFNLIRGSDPSPGANSTYDGNKVSFFGANISGANSIAEPGSVTEITDSQISVATVDGGISVQKLRIGKGAKISAHEYATETNMNVGDRFSDS